MKRILFTIAPFALAVWAFVETPAPPAGLAAYLPPSPLLTVEARDFHALLADWNTSHEKQAWLASDNFQVFSRSRLYQRLGDAQGEFATAAGLPADMGLADAVSGSESMLAIYDIGELHFLYITKLPSARAFETALWRTRSSYESRNVAGLNYFLRMDPASRRVVAFAAANDYLLLATREDLMAGALTLLAGKPGAAVTGERWYAESTRAAKNQGDLRLVMNLPALAHSAHFRSYWIQRNVSELKGYGAAIADLHRSAAGIREERVLLRFDQTSEPSTEPVPGVALMGSDNAGLSRGWSKPTAAAALDLIQHKILAPGPSTPPASESAPGVTQDANAGSESDLDTRIDEPPLAVTPANEIAAPVRKLIEAAPLEAMLNLSATRNVAGNVFVDIDTAVVLISTKDWDPAAVAAAFSAGPLARLSTLARGRTLIVANAPDFAAKLAAAPPAPAAAPGVTYTALFRHAVERPRYLKMMRVIDTVTSPRSSQEEDTGEPPFFSRNIGSLSKTLSKIDSVSVAARDTGSALYETVTYGFTQ